MQHTTTEIADIARIYLTVICIVAVVILTVWAVVRTTGVEATGNTNIPGVPLVSANQNDASPSSPDQGADDVGPVCDSWRGEEYCFLAIERLGGRKKA